MTAVLAKPAHSGARKGWGWVAIGVAVLVVGGLIAILSVGDWTRPDRFDPESPGPDGSMALVRILEDHGVEVTVARDIGQARQAVDEDATLVVADAGLPGRKRLAGLIDAAGATVVLSPQTAALRALIPGADIGGFGAGNPVAPGCRLPAARHAGAVVPGALYTTDGDADECYRTSGGAALLRAGDTSVLDADELFTNEHLAEHGNAALGVGLIASHSRVVWYMPSIGDAPAGQTPPSLGELTPGWVSPAIVLLLAAAAAAALWRGRRFGPLVAETLPVTVRADETTQGRARLYAKAGDAGHAADALRDGAVARLAGRLRISPHADAAEVADAAAGLIGLPVASVRGMLLAQPDTDASLAAFRRDLHDLEAAVEAAVHGEGKMP